MSVKDNQYSSSDIKVLSDRDHVRQRTQIYLGNMNLSEFTIPNFIHGFEYNTLQFVPSLFKSFNEVFDNSIDELTQHKSRSKTIDIEYNAKTNQYTITDNGRGIPIDMHASGKYTPEVAVGSLRAGRNFGANAAGVIGQNGVGAACANYCSTKFEVVIYRDNKCYKQTFLDGAKTVKKPIITDVATKKTGTSITMTPDPEVFKNGSTLPEVLLHNRAVEVAFNNPGVTVSFNNTKYKFANGLSDVVSSISKDYTKFGIDNMDFFVLFDKHQGLDEQVFTWVNSSLLYDGGLCNTQFVNAFIDATITHLEKDAKKLKCVVTKNDVRQNLLILGSLKIAGPEYDAQSKTRLTGPNLRKEMSQLVEANWKTFVRNNKDWLGVVLSRAAERHHASADKNAVKDLVKRSKKVPGLMDATGKDRSKCCLIVTEGDSAASSISEFRNTETMGSLPLTGKINNVYGHSAAELLKMGKIIHLIQAIGLIPGKKAVRSELNYGEVWISTDADQDGSDICALLVNLFFQFWPELFDPKQAPFIMRLIAPNVVAVKGDKRVHFINRGEYEDQKTKYKNWEVHYYKGLGSMTEHEWTVILNDSSYQLGIVDTDGTMKDTLQLLFCDDNKEDRKTWLYNENA
jgi:DNA gyrase subunit B